MAPSKEPLVSCLCVTEGRPAFMPWLLWSFDRQAWKRRELVIVDSSPSPFQIQGREDIRIVSAPPGTPVAIKRNRALKEARGQIVSWFDDDDWQHPCKLVQVVDALSEGAIYAGSSQGWFVDLNQLRCAPYRGSGWILFNSAGFLREAASSCRFPENLRRASDSRWMQQLSARYRKGARDLPQEILFFWLCHQTNLSNPATKRRFRKPLQALKDLLGAEAWGDTDEALQSLRTRLASQAQAIICRPTRRVAVQAGAPGKPRPASRSVPESEKGIRCGDDEAPPVSLMVKASRLDAPHLDTMIRHMASQARYPFAHKAIVVDRQPVLSGKSGSRSGPSNRQLDRILQKLLSDGIVDRVLDVDMAAKQVKRIMGLYFTDESPEAPTHSCSGGSIYAPLFGLEAMPTDHILQLDADIFFHSGSESWVRQALGFLARDPQLWLMMTHPGPPAGPPGKSLGRLNAGCARWDRQFGIWRFRHATSRYFLCDRRKLQGRLRPVSRRGGCAPLEQCISEALKRCQAFRGTLGDLQSWHLHAWHHPDPFPQWAPLLAKAVEAGKYPALQRGEHDLRLDRPRDRQQWGELLEGLKNEDAGRTTRLTKRRRSIPNRKIEVHSKPPVSVCLLSWKRPRNLQPIVRSLHGYEFVDEILVWNNNPRVSLKLAGNKVRVLDSDRNMGCYGRFLCAKQAKNDTVYVQDDDVIVRNVPQLFQKFVDDDSRIAHALAPSHWRRRDRDVYAQGHVALLGWGAFFRKEWLGVLDRCLDSRGADSLFRREADKFFTLLMGRRHNTLPARIRPLADAGTESIALHRQPQHRLKKALAVRRALELLRKSKSESAPVTWNVVIPCHNYGRYLAEAVESVLMNDADYLVTIVDDASSDHTPRICRQLSRQHSHVSFIRQDTCVEVGRARNLGVAAVASRFVALLDADDKIGPNYLFEAEKLLRSGHDVANPDAILFGGRSYRWRVPETTTLEMLLQRNSVHCSAAFRREYWEKVGGIDESMPNWQDYDFWIRLAKSGASIGKLPGDHFYYRIHGPSKSTQSHRLRESLQARIRQKHGEVMQVG